MIWMLAAALLAAPGRGASLHDDLFPARQHEAGAGIQGVLARDLDGDGVVDLVGVDVTRDRVVLLRGLAYGSFEPAEVLPTCEKPFELHVEDMTGDGVADLVVVGNEAVGGPATICVHPGLGDAAYAGAIETAFPYWITQSLVLDVDADGRLDLVLAHSVVGSGLSVVLGQGDGTFAPPIPQINQLGPRRITVVDLGGDALPDLALTEFKPGPIRNLKILENQGAGSFAQKQLFALDRTAYGIDAADVDGDGVVDLAVGFTGLSPLGGTVRFYLGNVAGGFVPGPETRIDDYFPWFVRLEDLDQDGALDLITSSLRSFSSDTGAVRLTFGVAGTVFEAASTVLPRITSSLEVVDADGDGSLDLVLARAGDRGFVELVPNRGGRSFLQGQNVLPRSAPTTTNTRDVGLGDVNGDGHLDVVAARLGSSYEIVVVPGTGDGGFAQPSHHPLPNNDFSDHFEVGDLDGDGRDDVLACSTLLSVYVSGADGKLGVPSTYYVGDIPLDAVLCDLVGDGRMEVATTLPISSEVAILELGAGQQLVETLRVPLPDPAFVLRAGDLDGDGAQDVVTGSVFDGTIGYLAAQPAGGFVFQPSAVLAGNFVADLCLEDWNGDGWLDAAAITPSAPAESRVTVLLGHGDGTLTPVERLATGDEPFALASADVDGDGLPDLIVSCAGSGNASVHLGLGDGSFAAPSFYGVAITNTGVAAGRLDDAGPADLVFGSDRYTALMLRNALP